MTSPSVSASHDASPSEENQKQSIPAVSSEENQPPPAWPDHPPSDLDVPPAAESLYYDDPPEHQPGGEQPRYEIYKDGKTNTTRMLPTRDELVSLIRDGECPGYPAVANRTRHIREHKAAHGKDKAYDDLKIRLPLLLFSSVCAAPHHPRGMKAVRASGAGLTHTCDTCHDFDFLTAEQHAALLSMIAETRYVWLGAASAGGDLYVVVRHAWTPKTPREHKDAWEYADRMLAAATGIAVESDEAVKGLRSGRFIAHDPHVFVRPESEIEPLPRPDPPAVTGSPLLTPPPPPEKHSNNGSGSTEYPPVDRDEVERMLSFLNPDQPPAEYTHIYPWWVFIGMCLHDESLDFLDLWITWSLKSAHFDDAELRSKWGSFTQGGGYTIGTVIHFARAAGFKWGNDKRWQRNAKPLRAELVTPEKAKKAFVSWVIEGERGPLRSSVANAEVALTAMAKRQSKGFRYNEFSHELVYGEEVIDVGLFDRIRSDVERSTKFVPTLDAVRTALNNLCKAAGYHPVRDYLSALQWDGEERLQTAGQTYFATEVTPLMNATAELLFHGLVARVMTPGSQFDYMPILFSEKQGTGKGRSCRILAGPWYRPGFSLDQWDLSKVMLERSRGAWLIEFQEIAGITRADLEKLKALISETADAARLAYRRDDEIRPRQFVMIGSTNQNYFLSDIHNRRMPILHIRDQIDLDALARDRDQLFAEAMAKRELYPDGHVTLPMELWPAAEERSRESRIISDAEDFISQWLSDQGDPKWFSSRALRSELNQNSVQIHDKERGRLLYQLGYESANRWNEAEQKTERGWRKRTWPHDG